MAEGSANIFWVNKLLEIEAADWERQLKRTVSETFISASQILIAGPPYVCKAY